MNPQVPVSKTALGACAVEHCRGLQVDHSPYYGRVICGERDDLPFYLYNIDPIRKGCP